MERIPELLCLQSVDPTSTLADPMWTNWILGDSARAISWADRSREASERFGAERNRVYALMASGYAMTVASRWQEGIAYFESGRTLIEATGAGQEWDPIFDPGKSSGSVSHS